MIEDLRIAGSLAGTLGAGAAFLRLLEGRAGFWDRGAGRRSGFGQLGWSFLAGAALVGVVLHVPLAIDGTIDRAWFEAVFALCILASAWCAWVLVRDRRRTRDASVRTHSWILDLPLSLRIGAGVLVAIALILIWFELKAPLATYDSRAIYGLKARVLYDIGTVRGEDFTDSARAHYHPQYPLLLPLHEAYLFWAQGSNGDAAIKWLSAAFTLALVLAFVDEVRRHTSDVAALVWGVSFLLTPAFLTQEEGGGLSGSADVPLAAFAFAGVVTVGRWFDEPRWQRAALAGLFLGAAASTKQEGLLFLAAAAVAAAYLCLRQSMWSASQAGAILAAGAVSAACIFVSASARSGLTESPFVRDYGMAMRMDWLAQLWQRPAEFVPFLLRQCLKTRAWNLVWPLLIAALFLRRPAQSSTVRSWRISLAIVSCAYFVIFWITPYNLQFHMFTALSRLALHLFPLAMLVLAEQLSASGITTQIVSQLSDARTSARVGK